MDNELAYEVPAPLEKFNGNERLAPENETILSGIEPAKILNKRQLRRAKKRLKALNKELSRLQADDLIAERERLIQERGDIRIAVLTTKQLFEAGDIDQDEYSAARRRWLADYKAVQKELQEVEHLLKPMRQHIILRQRLEQRITEHYQALEDQKEETRLTAEMAKEARYFAEIITKAWDALGLCYTYTVKNKKRRQSVQFERIIATPDSLQFKVFATKMALLNGTVNMLPPGVRVSQLVDDDTLIQLSTACERPVSCLNKQRDEWHNGVWLQIDRAGIIDGIVEYVTYSTVMSRYEIDKRESFPLPAGVKRGRHINWMKLVDHPHLLIAGQTGSGKSNQINVFISTLISQYSPEECQIVLIDLKEGVEFKRYEDVPHLITPVVHEIDQAAEILAQMEKERRRRMYEIGKVAHDIRGYNRVVSDKNRLPRIVIIIDEYAAVKADKHQAEVIHSYSTQLAMKARAAGIHMVIGVQSPTNDMIPNKVKDNITFVLSGRQRTLGSSLATMGNKQARDLKKIPGRMVCDDGSDVYPVQMPYISDDEIRAAIETAMNYGTPENAIDLEPMDNIVPINTALTESMIIQAALDHFDGALKARRLYDVIDHPEKTHSRINAIVKRLNALETIEHDGITYRIEKQPGNFYQMIDTGMQSYRAVGD